MIQQFHFWICISPGSHNNPETNPITIKPETASHMTAVLLGFLTLLISAQAPLPNKIS